MSLHAFEYVESNREGGDRYLKLKISDPEIKDFEIQIKIFPYYCHSENLLRIYYIAWKVRNKQVFFSLGIWFSD